MNGQSGDFKLSIRKRHFLILTIPLTVFITISTMLQNFGDNSLNPAISFDEIAKLGEVAARYRYLAAFLFLAAVSFAVLAIFAFDMKANFTRRSWMWASIPILLLSTVAFWFAQGDQQHVYDLLGQGFLEKALALGGVNCRPECSKGALSVFNRLTFAANLLVPLAASASLTGLVASLAKPDPSKVAPVRGLEAEAASLRSGDRIAGRYLFCLSALLTSGIIHFQAYLVWPAALIQASDRPGYIDLIRALSLYTAVGYSCLILAAYLPVMLLHSIRIEAFERALDAEQPRDSEEERGKPVAAPKFGYTEALNRIVAVLAPILANGIGSFGEGFFFG